MHSEPTDPHAGDDIQINIEPGGSVDSLGTADSTALRLQLIAAFAASMMLEGQLVVITDWLPGLHWRIQVSQQLADRLPGFTVDAIWNEIEPHLTRWLERPADAEVFWLPPAWGECGLVPAAYRCQWQPVAFTFRCRWSPSLERSEI